MKRKKKRRYSGRPSPEVQKTIDLTTGIVGLGVAGTVGATIPGMPGTIVMGGAMPIAATGLMGVAATDYRKKKRR